MSESKSTPTEAQFKQATDWIKQSVEKRTRDVPEERGDLLQDALTVWCAGEPDKWSSELFARTCARDACSSFFRKRKTRAAATTHSFDGDSVAGDAPSIETVVDEQRVAPTITEDGRITDMEVLRAATRHMCKARHEKRTGIPWDEDLAKSLRAELDSITVDDQLESEAAEALLELKTALKKTRAVYERVAHGPIAIPCKVAPDGTHEPRLLDKSEVPTGGPLTHWIHTEFQGVLRHLSVVKLLDESTTLKTLSAPGSPRQKLVAELARLYTRWDNEPSPTTLAELWILLDGWPDLKMKPEGLTPSYAIKSAASGFRPAVADGLEAHERDRSLKPWKPWWREDP